MANGGMKALEISSNVNDAALLRQFWEDAKRTNSIPSVYGYFSNATKMANSVKMFVDGYGDNHDGAKPAFDVIAKHMDDKYGNDMLWKKAKLTGTLNGISSYLANASQMKNYMEGYISTHKNAKFSDFAESVEDRFFPTQGTQAGFFAPAPLPVEGWKRAYDELLYEKSASAGKILDVSTGFVNALLDPLNPAHLNSFTVALEKFRAGKNGAINSKEKAEYGQAETLFNNKFGISLEQAEALISQIDLVRRRVATIDNLSPYIDIRKIDKAVGGAGLVGADKEYYDAKAYLLQNTLEGKSPFSNAQVYALASKCYLGVDAPSDLISTNEAILRDSAFERNRLEYEGLSAIIPSLNVRAQQDIYNYTIPEMIKSGLLDRRNPDEGIRAIESAIMRLDPTFAVFQNPAGVTGDRRTFTIDGFKAFVEKYASENNNTMPFVNITYEQNGISNTVSGQVKKSGNVYLIGLMSIDTAGQGLIRINGQQIDESAVTSYFVPREPVSLYQAELNTPLVGSVPSQHAWEALPSGKLEGFFRYGMPTLARYPKNSIEPMLNIINAHQDALIASWSAVLPNTDVISDITGAREALRRFNESLESLLFSNDAKEAATSKIKLEPGASSFKTITPRERTFLDLTARSLDTKIVALPHANVQYDPLKHYKLPIGSTIRIGSERDAQNFFGLGMQSLEMPGKKNIPIEKYFYDMTPAVVNALSQKMRALMPDLKTGRLTFNATDIALSASKREETGKDDQIGGSLEYRSHYGRNTFYNAKSTYLDNGITTGSFDASAYNSPLPLTRTMLAEGTTSERWEPELNRIENYLRFLTPNKNMAAFFVTADEKTNSYSLRVGFQGADGRYTSLTALENLNESQVRLLFQHFNIDSSAFGPQFGAKFIDKEGSGLVPMDGLLDRKDFAGAMFAVNVGLRFGMAGFTDPDFNSATLGQEINRLLVSELGLPTEKTKVKVSYNRRDAFSSFFDVNQSAGLYAQIFSTRKESEGETVPEFSVKYVVDNRFSAEGGVALSSWEDKGEVTDYYGIGRYRMGNSRLQLATATSDSSLLSLPSSIINLGHVGATEMLYNLDDNSKLERYAALNLLYQTEGTLWSQVDGRNNLNRTVSMKYDDLLNWHNSSLSFAQQKSNLPEYANNAYAGLFTFRGPGRTMIDTQTSAATLDDYKTEAYGLNVREIWLDSEGRNKLSLGAIFGSRKQEGKTDELAGGGMRVTLGDCVLALQGVNLGNENDNAGAFGFAYLSRQSERARLNYAEFELNEAKTSAKNERDPARKAALENKVKKLQANVDTLRENALKPEFRNYFIASGRKEKSTGYSNWNLYDLARYRQAGMYAYYDEQKEVLTVAETQSPEQIAKLTQSGARLFFISQNGVWQVFGEVTDSEETAPSIDQKKRMLTSGVTYRKGRFEITSSASQTSTKDRLPSETYGMTTTANLGIKYTQVPGLPAMLSPYLQNAELSLAYDLAGSPGYKKKGVSAYLKLHFARF